MINLIDWGHISGGWQNQLGLLRAWRKAGHQVSMISPASVAPGLLPDELKASLLTTPTVRRFGLPLSLNTFLQIPELCRQRSRFDPEVVYTRVNFFTPILVAICRLMRMQVVVEHNSWLAKERTSRRGSAITARIEEIMQIWSARMAHASRCVTQGIADRLQELGADATKLHYIGNGTDVERFHPMPRVEALQAFGLPPTSTYVGYIGNLMPWHGVSTAIDAFALLAAEDPALQLLIFGDGPELSALHEQAHRHCSSARIRLLGRVPVQRANAAINCLDIALLPLSERHNVAYGFSSTKIRDYAAAGRLVVCGHLPGNVELAGNGWLFTHAPDDPRSLADALRCLLKDRQTWDAASRAARRYAEERLEWDIFANQIIKTFESGLSEANRHVNVG